MGMAFRQDSLSGTVAAFNHDGQVADDGGDGIYSTNSTSIRLVPSDNSIDRL
jgi:hypothetical protein